MRKLAILFTVLFSLQALAQEKELPNIVGKNVVAVEFKYGRQGEAFRAWQLSYERFLFRSSLVSAHGLKVAAGQYAWTSVGFENYQSKADFIFTSSLGAFRHFLVLELGYSMLPNQPDFSIYPTQSNRFIINAGYKYHRVKPGLFYSIMGGNNANLSLGLGYTF